MLLTILAAFAQEESRSLSENVKWGIRKRFAAGEAQHKRLIGYEVNGDQYSIIPEEARTVRQIFDLYETGRWSFRAIAKRMEKEGRLTITGNNRWDESRIYTIIMNEKYVGDILMQKNYSENHITHKEVKNRDRVVPQYYLRDHHECCPYVNTNAPPQKARKMGVSWDMCVAHPSSQMAKRRQIGEL